MKKIKGLRSQYTREKQKERLMSESDGVFVSKWMHFQSLCFLDEHVTPRPRKSILNMVSTCKGFHVLLVM